MSMTAVTLATLIVAGVTAIYEAQHSNNRWRDGSS